MGSLTDAFFNSVTKRVYDWVIRAIIDLFGVVNDFLSASFLSHNFVQGSLGFFKVLGGVMLAVGFLRMMFKELEQQSHGEGFQLADRLFSTLKAYALLLFCEPVVVVLHQYLMNLVDALTNATNVPLHNLTVYDFSQLASSVLKLIILIIVLVCTIKIIFDMFKQCAIMYIQILTGYLYVYDVAGGNDGAIGEWGRDVVSGRLTFALQVLFYQTGMYETLHAFTGGSVAASLVGCVFLFGGSVIPTALRRWGYANQSAGGAFGRLVSTAAMVLPRFIA